jgi:hypothetical protein
MGAPETRVSIRQGGYLLGARLLEKYTHAIGAGPMQPDHCGGVGKVRRDGGSPSPAESDRAGGPLESTSLLERRDREATCSRSRQIPAAQQTARGPRLFGGTTTVVASLQATGVFEMNIAWGRWLPRRANFQPEASRWGLQNGGLSPTTGWLSTATRSSPWRRFASSPDSGDAS